MKGIGHEQKIVQQGFGTVTVTGKDKVTGENYETDMMATEDLKSWLEGARNIHAALPYASARDKKFLLKGIIN